MSARPAHTFAAARSQQRPPLIAEPELMLGLLCGLPVSLCLWTGLYLAARSLLG